MGFTPARLSASGLRLSAEILSGSSPSSRLYGPLQYNSLGSVSVVMLNVVIAHEHYLRSTELGAQSTSAHSLRVLTRTG